MKYPVPIKVKPARKAIQDKILDNLSIMLDEIYEELQEEYDNSYLEEYESYRENGDSAADAKESALDNLKSQFLNDVTTRLMERLTDEVEGCLDEFCEA